MTFDIVLLVATLAPLVLGFIAIGIYTFGLREDQAQARDNLRYAADHEHILEEDIVAAVDRGDFDLLKELLEYRMRLNRDAYRVGRAEQYWFGSIALVAVAFLALFVDQAILGLAGLAIFKTGGCLRAEYTAGHDRLDPEAVQSAATRKGLSRLERLRRDLRLLLLDENRTPEEIDQVWHNACAQACTHDLVPQVRARIDLFEFPLFHLQQDGSVRIEFDRSVALYERDKELFYQAFRLGHMNAHNLASAQSIAAIWQSRETLPEEIEEDCSELLNPILARVAKGLCNA